MPKKVLAELVGTFALVFLAVGAAVAGIAGTDVPGSGVLGVALAFGLTLIALAYALGPISGCHINPAVTLAMVVGGRLKPQQAMGYWTAQVLGGILGGFALWLLVSGLDIPDQTGGLGTNAYADIGIPAAFLVEVLLTMLFILVILLATDHTAEPGSAGLTIGASLTVVHLVGIPLTGTSVNPARSLGPALFAGTDALSQVWLFILAPLVGGVLAAIVWKAVRLPEPRRRRNDAAAT